eukprot:scaffold216089_cov20-Tisochrysis_lutea.AAC.1
MDTDKDGVVSMEELCQALEQRGVHVPDEHAKVRAWVVCGVVSVGQGRQVSGCMWRDNKVNSRAQQAPLCTGGKVRCFCWRMWSSLGSPLACQHWSPGTAQGLPSQRSIARSIVWSHAFWT